MTESSSEPLLGGVDAAASAVTAAPAKPVAAATEEFSESPTDESVQQFLGSWSWLIPDEVNTRAKDLAKRGKPLNMFHVAGPMIQDIWYVTFWQWGFALAFPWFVCWVSTCPGEKPFADYPRWVWFLFVPPICYSLLCECRALRWALRIIVESCAPFKMMGVTMTFPMWAIYLAGLSLMTHFDLATNGLFLAKVMKTAACHGSLQETITAVWHHVIRNSPMVNLVGFGHIDRLFLFGWALMFVQPLFSALNSQPVRVVDYGPASEAYGYRTVWSMVEEACDFCMDKLLGRKANKHQMHHVDVLQLQALTNRMVSLTDKALAVGLSRAKAEGTKSSGRVYLLLSSEIYRITVRLWLVNILEKGFMLEAQTTIFSISTCLMPRESSRLDPQIVLSLVLSFATFNKAILDALGQWNLIQRTLAASGLGKEDEKLPRLLRESKASIEKTRRYFLVGIVLLLLLACHCGAKFLMAFLCEDSLWNIPLSAPFFGPPPGQDWRGCVDLSAVLHPGEA